MLVTLSIALNVGLIASVKYLPVLPWVLPLALSFYGFQSLTYTIDIYRRDAKPAESYLAYLASASFFPTTVAGPITRLSTLWPQWSKREMLSRAGRRQGAVPDRPGSGEEAPDRRFPG